MEVHHHSHTARKKWTHYFWEFLMLFLAVFCGFLAENQREHMIEHQREKKYMISLVNELTTDMAEVKPVLLDSSWIKGQDSLLNLLYNNPNSSIDTRLVYYLYTAYTKDIDAVLPNNNTLTQLKNSGSMRLIRNKEVVDSLYALSTYTAAIDKQLDLFLYYTFPQYSAASAKIINEKYILKSDPDKLKEYFLSLTEKPELVTYSAPAIIEFSNYVRRINGTRKIYISILAAYYHYCASLIPFIKKEYHLK